MTQAVLNQKKITEKEFLDSYDIKAFERPSVTVDILILTVSSEAVDNYRRLPEKKLKVLLIKRNEHPFINKWALPGGFVKMNESLESAAYRELIEETNVQDIYLEQLYTYGDLNRDPRGRIISTAYMSLVDSETLDLQAGTDATDAKWFDVSYQVSPKIKVESPGGPMAYEDVTLILTNGTTELSASIRISRSYNGKSQQLEKKITSNKDIAFDHCKIIQFGIERLRHKVEYSDIVMALMPEYFTLTDLQKTYEQILGKPLLKANFRRKISPMVLETDQSTAEAGHRPSKLFKYNPDWANQS